jgi:hypothetical protein
MPWNVLHHVPAKTGSGVSGEESEAAELLAAYRPDYFVSGHKSCFSLHDWSMLEPKTARVALVGAGSIAECANSEPHQAGQ